VLPPESMEVMRVTGRDGAVPEPPFELDRLNAEEREVWERHFTGPLAEGDSWAIRIWSFGYWCMLELYGPPKVVCEWLEEVDPDNKILQYIENVRRARGGG
jgi:hypothetical protein